MLYTSSEANKLIRTLRTQEVSLRNGTSRVATYTVGLNEEVVKPDYDFIETEKEIEEIQRKIRKIKHAINIFNLSTKVDGLNMSIDELLVALPQWTDKLGTYTRMKNRLAKTRKSYNGNVEYECINYDLKEVEEAYNALSQKITDAQTKLDLINNTQRFEIDV